jgi:hypothetical protein
MAYPLTSELGNLTCTAGSGDLLYLFGTAIRVGSDVATLTIESNEYDATTPTGSAVSMRTMNAGLRSGTVAFTGIYPRASNPLGLSSKIEYAGGYVQYVNGFTLNMSFPEIDITSATNSASSYRRWMPGGTGTWGGTYTCKADNATALSMPTVGAASAATFTLAEGGVTDPTLTGDITTPRLVQTVKIGAESVAVYSFSGSGALTQAAGTSVPGIFAASGAITKPSWDLTGTDGVPDNTCVLTVASGRTYTFPAFWTNLSLTWQMDQPVQVSGTLRIADTVTVA